MVHPNIFTVWALKSYFCLCESHFVTPKITKWLGEIEMLLLYVLSEEKLHLEKINLIYDFSNISSFRFQMDGTLKPLSKFKREDAKPKEDKLKKGSKKKRRNYGINKGYFIC